MASDGYFWQNVYLKSFAKSVALPDGSSLPTTKPQASEWCHAKLVAAGTQGFSLPGMARQLQELKHSVTEIKSSVDSRTDKLEERMDAMTSKQDAILQGISQLLKTVESGPALRARQESVVLEHALPGAEDLFE